MKKLLTGLLLCSACSGAIAENWELIKQYDDGDKVYSGDLKQNSEFYTDNGSKEAWIKTEIKNPRKEYSNRKTIRMIELYRAYCSSGPYYSVPQAVEYYSDGSSKSFNEDGEWQTVLPESPQEIIYNHMCGIIPPENRWTYLYSVPSKKEHVFLGNVITDGKLEPKQVAWVKHVFEKPQKLGKSWVKEVLLRTGFNCKKKEFAYYVFTTYDTKNNENTIEPPIEWKKIVPDTLMETQFDEVCKH